MPLRMTAIRRDPKERSEFGKGAENFPRSSDGNSLTEIHGKVIKSCGMERKIWQGYAKRSR